MKTYIYIEGGGTMEIEIRDKSRMDSLHAENEF